MIGPRLWIRDRLTHYFAAVDRGDLAQVVELLDGVALNFRGTVVPAGGVEAFYRPLLDGPRMTKHVLTDLTVEADGNEVLYSGEYQRFRTDMTSQLDAVGEIEGWVTMSGDEYRWRRHAVGPRPVDDPPVLT